jgi:hypothetical protein
MSAVVEGRGCGGCTLCCKLMGVEELDKPRGIWCSHCDPRKGCKIYGHHPEECRNFLCGYLTNAGLGEIWNPTKCRMVLTYAEKSVPRLSVHVDPARSGIWRQPPYHAELKRFARAAAQSRAQVIVWEGRKAIAVLPDRDKELGEVKADQFIVTTEVMGRDGTTLDVVVLDGNDPRFLAIKARSGGPKSQAPR